MNRYNVTITEGQRRKLLRYANEEYQKLCRGTRVCSKSTYENGISLIKLFQDLSPIEE